MESFASELLRRFLRSPTFWPPIEYKTPIMKRIPVITLRYNPLKISLGATIYAFGVSSPN